MSRLVWLALEYTEIRIKMDCLSELNDLPGGCVPVDAARLARRSACRPLELTTQAASGRAQVLKDKLDGRRQVHLDRRHLEPGIRHNADGDQIRVEQPAGRARLALPVHVSAESFHYQGDNLERFSWTERPVSLCQVNGLLGPPEVSHPPLLGGRGLNYDVPAGGSALAAAGGLRVGACNTPA